MSLKGSVIFCIRSVSEDVTIKDLLYSVYDL